MKAGSGSARSKAGQEQDVVVFFSSFQVVRRLGVVPGPACGGGQASIPSQDDYLRGRRPSSSKHAIRKRLRTSRPPEKTRARRRLWRPATWPWVLSKSAPCLRVWRTTESRRRPPHVSVCCRIGARLVVGGCLLPRMAASAGSLPLPHTLQLLRTVKPGARNVNLGSLYPLPMRLPPSPANCNPPFALSGAGRMLP